MSITATRPRPTHPASPRATPWWKRAKGRATALRYVLLILVLVLLIGPLVVPLLGAFKGAGEPVFGPNASVLPQQPSLDAFSDLIAQTNLLQAVANSLIIGVLAVASHVILATVGGYILSRKGWRGRTLLMLLMMSALIFPFESIMVSLFAQVRELGFYDTLIGVWLPGMLGPFHPLLMRAAFLGVPDELEDAALLDGAGEWKRFWSIFLPQTRGALTIVALTSFLYAWEDYLWPLLVLRTGDNFTMMLELARLQSAFGFDYRVVLAGAIVALVPVTVMFFFTQKFFFRGIEEGGLKL